jgi:hypothetical protein
LGKKILLRRTGGTFDEGNIIDGRWAIIDTLVAFDEIPNGAFNGRIDRVKDLYIWRIFI